MVKLSRKNIFCQTEDGNTISQAFAEEKQVRFMSWISLIRQNMLNYPGKEIEMKVRQSQFKIICGVDASLLEDVSKEYITDGEKFLSIEVKNMDVQALEKRQLQGEIIIKADENKMPAFALYSLDWTFEGDAEKRDQRSKVLAAAVQWLR